VIEWQRNPVDLLAATRGGPALWKQTLETKGRLGTPSATDPNAAAYVVDTIEPPFKNPWNSWIRFGGFDFFPDGKSAALCTWSGDVWVVSGIDERLEKLTWKRFAAGLFQPLGLKVVDGKVYVHGRDQITRLHDLNNDGEADFYESFNNDLMVTPGFHEFNFDLHTDPEGNFYFAKAGPVNPGGVTPTTVSVRSP
jgi:glucose/arabinose dehydrogenase